MIIQEMIILKSGRELVKTYSDMYTIQQVETGIIYDEAIDVPGKYTYEETKEYNHKYKQQLEENNGNT
jgi:hypothetical protein